MAIQNNNPWKALAPYEVNDDKIFCGRDTELREITTLIEYDSVVTLYGKSGIGKTSLLNAGVIPNLSLGDYIPKTIRLGEYDNIDTFAEIILSHLSDSVTDIDYTQKDVFVNFFKQYRLCNNYGESATAIIILDQFEEILINNSSEAQLLLKQVAEWKRNVDNTLSDCHFVISIREDDLYLLEELIDKYRLNSLRSARYRLRGITQKGAEDIIRNPGRDIIHDDEVVGKILSRLNNNAGEDGEVVFEASELSLICSQLYHKMVDGNMKNITTDLVVRSARSSIEEYYRAAIKDLSAKQISIIESDLITDNGRRSFMSADRFNKIFSENIRNTLVQGDYRFLHVVNNRVEVVHDTLALAIKRVRDERMESDIDKRKFADYLWCFLAYAIVYAPLMLAIYMWKNLATIARENRIEFTWDVINYDDGVLYFLVLLSCIILTVIFGMNLVIFGMNLPSYLVQRFGVHPTHQKLGRIYANRIWLCIIGCIITYLCINDPYIGNKCPDYLPLAFVLSIIFSGRQEKFIWRGNYPLWYLLFLLALVCHVYSVSEPILDYIYMGLYAYCVVFMLFYYRHQIYKQVVNAALLILFFCASIPMPVIDYFSNLPFLRITPRESIIIEKSDSVYIIPKRHLFISKNIAPKLPLSSIDRHNDGLIGYLPIQPLDEQERRAVEYDWPPIYPLGKYVEGKGCEVYDMILFYTALHNIDKIVKDDGSDFVIETLNPIKSNYAKLFIEVMDDISENYIRRGTALKREVPRLDSINCICNRYLDQFAEKYRTTELSGEDITNYIRISTIQLSSALLYDLIENNRAVIALDVLTHATYNVLYDEAYEVVTVNIINGDYIYDPANNLIGAFNYFNEIGIFCSFRFNEIYFSDVKDKTHLGEFRKSFWERNKDLLDFSKKAKKNNPNRIYDNVFEEF